MTKKDYWQIFMKTGKVSDYLNYKNAKEEEDAFPPFDEEVSDEFAVDFINNFDSDFPALEEYEDVDQNGRFSDS